MPAAPAATAVQPCRVLAPLIAIVFLIASCTGSRTGTAGHGLTDPALRESAQQAAIPAAGNETVHLDQATIDPSTRQWFNSSDGQLIIDVADALPALWTDPDSCEATAARLDEKTSPMRFAAAANSASGSVVEVTFAMLSALERTLVACGADDPVLYEEHVAVVAGYWLLLADIRKATQ